MKNTFRPIRIAGLLVLTILITSTFYSCDKYSSPRKVERIITEDRWVITMAFIDNVNETNLFADLEFRFDKSGSIDVIGDPAISGKWTTDAQKNPTTLGITITPFVPFNHLNSDWTYTLCTKERMELEVDGAASKDILIFSKQG